MCQHQLVLIVPYDTDIYMTWKDAEANLLLGEPQQPMSTEGWKLYNLNDKVRKKTKRAYNRAQNYEIEEYNKNVLPLLVKEDEVDIKRSKVNITRGGSCSFTVNGSRFGGNHLDYWAGSIFNTDLNQ